MMLPAELDTNPFRVLQFSYEWCVTVGELGCIHPSNFSIVIRQFCSLAVCTILLFFYLSTTHLTTLSPPIVTDLIKTFITILYATVPLGNVDISLRIVNRIYK